MSMHRKEKTFRGGRSTRFGLAGVSAIAMASTLVAPAFAQTTDDPEVVVVTATKRETSAQDIPLAVAAISGDSMAEYQVDDMAALAQIEPSFQVQALGAGETQIIVRGIQSAGASMVGVYVDEAVVTGSDFAGNSTRQSAVQMFDINRVELLKGPQGTLFGSGSMAGTLRVIPNLPDLFKVSGDISAGASFGDGVNPLYEANGTLNLPVVDGQFGIRVTGWVKDGGGFIDRLEPFEVENSNDQHTLGVRAIGLWQPTEKLSLRFMAVRQDLDVDDVQTFMASQDDYAHTEATFGMWDETNSIYSGVLDYELSVGTVTVSSSYNDKSVYMIVDTTPTAAAFGLPGAYPLHETQDRSVWSSEARFASDLSGPVQFVVGAFYEQDRDWGENMIGVTSFAEAASDCISYADCVARGIPETVISSRGLGRDVDHTAVFGQVDYEFLPKWTLTAGVRYYEADLHYTELQNQGIRFPTSPVQAAPIWTLDAETTQDSTSYNFSLNWEPTDEITIYGRAASGFRIGGINAASFASDFGNDIPADYGSDELWSYELGAKTSWFNRKLYVEGAVYYIDWKDQQVNGYTEDGAFEFITNAGASEVKGAELQITAHPIDGLSMSIGATYTDSQLTEDQPSSGSADEAAPGVSGDRVPLVPKWTYAGRVRYDFPVATYEGYVQTSFNYRGSSYTTFNSANPNYREIEEYFMMDAAAGMIVDEWDMRLFVSNLTDEVPQLGVYVGTDGYRIATAPPRMFGARISTSF